MVRIISSSPSIDSLNGSNELINPRHIHHHHPPSTLIKKRLRGVQLGVRGVLYFRCAGLFCHSVPHPSSVHRNPPQPPPPQNRINIPPCLTCWMGKEEAISQGWEEGWTREGVVTTRGNEKRASSNPRL